MGLLATAALATIFTLTLQAQDNGGLRGRVDPAAATATPQAQNNNPALPAYVPVSPGAVPDEPSEDAPRKKKSDSLFGDIADPSADSADDSNEAPAPPARRSTTRQTAADRTPTTTSDKKIKAEQDETLDDRTTGALRMEALNPAEKIKLGDDAGRVSSIDDRDIIKDDDPFAPLGIRVGSFILRPSIEQGITATSNANYSTNGESAVLSETTLRLNAVSDWGRHSASLDAYGNFRETLDGYDISETRAGVDAALNLDLSDEMRARGTLSYERRPETASSPVEIVGTTEEPVRQTFGTSLGLEKDVGKARYGVTALIEHEDYGDAQLSDGSVLSQDDRNSTLATVTIRGGYQISPAFTPFVEAELGHRYYDDTVDSAGYERDSDRFGLRGGVEVDLNEKIIGEVSGGWIREKFADDRLRAIDGPSLSAALTWSPERETSVKLAATTTVEGTTDAGESGSILHQGLLTVERRIRSNLTANAILGVGYRDYSDTNEHDLLLSAEVGSTWWLNRYTGVTGRLRHERQQSDPDTRDYDANSVFLGIKVQR